MINLTGQLHNVSWAPVIESKLVYIDKQDYAAGCMALLGKMWVKVNQNISFFISKFKCFLPVNFRWMLHTDFSSTIDGITQGREGSDW